MEWQKTIIDLGIGGAALFILYKVAGMLFDYLNNRNKGDAKGIDRLCSKLDTLVDSNNQVIQKMTEVMLSNNKDQAQLLHILEEQYTTLQDVLKKVIRIDVRTQSCLKEEVKEEI
jgi:hypothetical protein